jgi:ATP phosphoribosyltransferase regulatory subunit
LKTLGRLSEDEARAVIDDVLAIADIKSVGARGTPEITERLLEMAADASTLNMARETVALIETFLEIAGPAEGAAQQVRALTKAAGIDLGPALAAYERRLSLLSAASVDISAAHFAASFGRTLDYYSGFVFEIESARGDRLAAGGRYDGLLGELGASRAIPAVGGALFCTGILSAKGTR